MADRTILRGNTSGCASDPIDAQSGSQTPPDQEVTEIETPRKCEYTGSFLQFYCDPRQRIARDSVCFRDGKPTDKI